MNESKQPPSPTEQIFQLTMSYMPSRALGTAVQLGLFSHIAAGNKTAQEIAKAAGASKRGMEMLLNALVGFQLLTKKNGNYELTPPAADFLVRESPNYMGHLMESDALWESWGHLADVVRSGKPYVSVEQQSKAEEFFPKLVRGLHVTNREPARRAAEVLMKGKANGPLEVLDVACGSGIWGISVAEANPKARITFQDYPGLLSVTHEYVLKHGIEDRSGYLPGNLREVDFGTNRFDLALLGNILHSEGEPHSRGLLKKLARAIKPGGRVVIIDMLPNEDRTGPPFALLFAINMLVNTTEGDTYTLGEYTKWLNDAGFSKVETAEIGSHSPVVIGIKSSV